jgi:hypothetical protein
VVLGPKGIFPNVPEQPRTNTLKNENIISPGLVNLQWEVGKGNICKNIYTEPLARGFARSGNILEHREHTPCERLVIAASAHYLHTFVAKPPHGDFAAFSKVC